MTPWWGASQSTRNELRARLRAVLVAVSLRSPCSLHLIELLQLPSVNILTAFSMQNIKQKKTQEGPAPRKDLVM